MENKGVWCFHVRVGVAIQLRMHSTFSLLFDLSSSGVKCLCSLSPYYAILQSKMPLNLGDVFPNLEVDTSEGKLSLHDYWGDG